MMKLLITIYFFCSFIFCEAQNKVSNSIQNILETQQNAWNTGNLDAFMEPYWHSDSLMFIGKSGIIYGWQQTLDNYKRSYPTSELMGKLTFRIKKINQLSPTDISVVGQWHLDRSLGNLEGYFTLLWKKIKGRWVIVQDHSS